jgi:hypothetical protein
MRCLLAIGLLGCGSVAVPPPVSDDAGTPVSGDAGTPDGGPASARWMLVQTRSVQSQTTNTPVIVSLEARHLIVVAVQVDVGGLLSITDNSDCNSYLPIHAADADCGGDGLRMFYVKSSCAGAEVIGIGSTKAVHTAVVWEVSGIRSDDPLDTASALDTQSPSATPLGPPITTSADGDLIISAVDVDDEVTGIHAGNEFTNDSLGNGNGWAHITSASAKAGIHQAQWDQPQPTGHQMPGEYCASAAAFKAAP